MRPVSPPWGIVPGEPSQFRQGELKEVEKAAQSLGVHLQILEVEAPDELEAAFAAMTREGAQALFMFGSSGFGVGHV